MYCPNCAYNNPPALRRCRNCEIDLYAGPEQAAPQPAAAAGSYASLPLRLLATLLDLLLLLALIILLLAGVVGVVAITGVDGILHDAEAGATLLWGSMALFLGYLVALEAGASKGTLGKRWLNLAVHDAAGQPLGILRAGARLLLRLATLPLLPLLLIQPFTPRKQALHDLLTDAVVTQRGDSKKVAVMAPLLVLFIALMLPAIALLATAGKPLFQQYIQQVQLQKGLKAGHVATLAVARFYRLNGHVPATIEDTPAIIKSPLIEAITINQQNGEVSVEFDATARKDIRRRHLLFTPALAADQSISWKCHSPDIASYLLPPDCL